MTEKTTKYRNPVAVAALFDHIAQRLRPPVFPEHEEPAAAGDAAGPEPAEKREDRQAKSNGGKDV